MRSATLAARLASGPADSPARGPAVALSRGCYIPVTKFDVINQAVLAQCRGQDGGAKSDAFLTDPLAQALHLLGRHFDLGQLRQVFAALLEGRIVHASINDLVEHGHAVAAAINGQALALREKKPADICGSNVWVLAIRPRRHAL